jgi:hypothetical protein
VVAEQVDLARVFTGQSPEMLQAGTASGVVVGPLRGEPGDGVVVGGVFDPKVLARISHQGNGIGLSFVS